MSGVQSTMSSWRGQALREGEGEGRGADMGGVGVEVMSADSVSDASNAVVHGSSLQLVCTQWEAGVSAPGVSHRMATQ